nr:unnamed protein product [Digitaria exilis]
MDGSISTGRPRVAAAARKQNSQSHHQICEEAGGRATGLLLCSVRLLGAADVPASTGTLLRAAPHRRTASVGTRHTHPSPPPMANWPSQTQIQGREHPPRLSAVTVARAPPCLVAKLTCGDEPRAVRAPHVAALTPKNILLRMGWSIEWWLRTPFGSVPSSMAALLHTYVALRAPSKHYMSSHLRRRSIRRSALGRYAYTIEIADTRNEEYSYAAVTPRRVLSSTSAARPIRRYVVSTHAVFYIVGNCEECMAAYPQLQLQRLLAQPNRAYGEGYIIHVPMPIDHGCPPRALTETQYPSRFPRFPGTFHPIPITQTHWKAWKPEFLPSQASPVGVQKVTTSLQARPLNTDSNTASPAFPVAMDNTTAGIKAGSDSIYFRIRSKLDVILYRLADLRARLPPSAPAKPRMVLARAMRWPCQADHLGRACAFVVRASALRAPCAMEYRTAAVEAPARPLDEPRASCTRCAEEARGAPASRPGSADGDLSLARSGGERKRKKTAALSHRIWLAGGGRDGGALAATSCCSDEGEGGNELGFPSPRLFRGFIPRRRAADRSQPSDLNERLRSRRGARGRGGACWAVSRPARLRLPLGLRPIKPWAASAALLSRAEPVSRAAIRAEPVSRAAIRAEPVSRAALRTGPRSLRYWAAHCAAHVKGCARGCWAFPLNGANFLDWKGKVMTCLAWNNLDVAFREDRPAVPAEGQTSPAFDKWERSNRMATMVMSQTISPGIKGAIPLKNAQGVEYTAKELLTKIEENFKSSSKTYASTLIMKLVSSQYNGKTGIREHILSMCDMANKLKEMQMEISDGFLVHFILTSLPSPQYAAFKINYNTTKAIWTLSDLISYCVEEEERLKTEKMKDVVNMVGNLSLSDTPKNQHESGSSKQGANKNFKKNKNKNFAPKHENKFEKSSHTSGGKMLCSFCESPKHLQKNCAGFKEWLKQQVLFKQEAVPPKKYPSRFPRFPGTFHPIPITQTHWKAWKPEFLPSQASPVGVQKSLKERLRYKPDVALNTDSNTASPAFPVAMDNTTAGIKAGSDSIYFRIRSKLDGTPSPSRPCNAATNTNAWHGSPDTACAHTATTTPPLPVPCPGCNATRPATKLPAAPRAFNAMRRCRSRWGSIGCFRSGCPDLEDDDDTSKAQSCWFVFVMDSIHSSSGPGPEGREVVPSCLSVPPVVSNLEGCINQVPPPGSGQILANLAAGVGSGAGTGACRGERMPPLTLPAGLCRPRNEHGPPASHPQQDRARACARVRAPPGPCRALALAMRPCPWRRARIRPACSVANGPLSVPPSQSDPSPANGGWPPNDGLPRRTGLYYPFPQPFAPELKSFGVSSRHVSSRPGTGHGHWGKSSHRPIKRKDVSPFHTVTVCIDVADQYSKRE